MVQMKLLILLYIMNLSDCLKTSYPFSCNNPKFNFSKEIELSLKKTYTKRGNPPEW